MAMCTKQRIPKALREQVWLKTNRHKFEVKCPINWCRNKINAFDFHVGHNIPESKGGATTIDNLKPLCARRNLSMSNSYTITLFSNEFAESHTNTNTLMLGVLFMVKFCFTTQVAKLIFFFFRCTYIYNEIVRIV